MKRQEILDRIEHIDQEVKTLKAEQSALRCQLYKMPQEVVEKKTYDVSFLDDRDFGWD
jgi:regulator of replication initiation timing